MKSLLSSYFSRMWKSRVFWICAAVMAALAIQRGAVEFSIFGQKPMDRWTIILFDDIQYQLPCILGIFTALFLGGEYTGGAVRNKLIVGRARWGVYCSALITVSAVTAFLVLLYAGVTAVLCWRAHGPMPDPSLVPAHLGAVLLVCVAWSALFTAMCLNCARPAVSVVACLAVVGITYVACMKFFFTEVDHDNSTEAVLSRFFYDLLPIGQGDQLRDIYAGSMSRSAEELMPYSVLFITLTTAAGLPLFRRKNLK